MYSKKYFEKLNSLSKAEQDKCLQSNLYLAQFIDYFDIDINKIVNAIQKTNALGDMLRHNLNSSNNKELCNAIIAKLAIIADKNLYDSVVNNIFKENMLLRNKWIRYGDHLRDRDKDCTNTIEIEMKVPCKAYRLPLLKPFVQKSLLKQKFLPGSIDQGCQDIALLIHKDIVWHWRNRKGLLANIEFLTSKAGEQPQATAIYIDIETRTIEDQPIWDLNFPMQKFPEFDRDFEPVDERFQNNMETLAWYNPAHTSDKTNYGIHLTIEGIVRLADELQQLGITKTNKVFIQLASVFHLYAHELCHAWVEDLCALIEFSECEGECVNQRRYALVQHRFNGYIFMEEALCNSAAQGWLTHFLQVSGDEQWDCTELDAPELILAFEKWMVKQPKGYRDFLAIGQPPYSDQRFMHNFWRLLVEIYHVDKYQAKRALEIYFAGQFDFDDDRWHQEVELHPWDEAALWGGEPPIHLHLQIKT